MEEYKLRGRRAELNIKQSDMAKDLGISPQYLNNIEKGKVEPRRDLMKKISEILKKSAEELFF